jgi:hypothetical protein
MICTKCGLTMRTTKRSGERFTRDNGNHIATIVDRHHEFECDCGHVDMCNFEHLIHRIPKRWGNEKIDR